jgi:hypothetical protein
VVGDTKGMAIARTGVFFGGQGLIWTLFILAGNEMR